MRNKFSDAFYEESVKSDQLCLIVADISPAGSLAKFRERSPQRFVNVGVAEQIMIGMAAGLSMRGFQPFVYTIATFSLYRPFEFVRDDLCYQNLPVTIVGIGGGVSYSTLGTTHHAQEDVAIAMTIPNMNVLAPCDPLEVEVMTRWCTRQKVGPVYLRLGKAGEPDLTASALDSWEFGKIRRLRPGKDHCIITYGVITKLALALADQLEARGTSCEIVTVPTLKPLDRDGLMGVLQRHSNVTVIEESAPRALGLEVEALAFRSGYQGSLNTFALKDEFIHCYGSHDDILAVHGLSLAELAAKLGS
jgi:transketolase